MFDLGLESPLALALALALAPTQHPFHRFIYSFVQWAYGVTCWEVFSGGKTPYPGVHPLELSRQLESGERMKKPLNAACSDEM